MMGAPIWPDGLTAYKRSPEFTEGSIPAALMRDHATKEGVWARLHVLEGQLRFIDQEGGAELMLGPGVHEVIFPCRLHRVAPVNTLRFFVEFCRKTEDVAANPGIDADLAFPHRGAKA